MDRTHDITLDDYFTVASLLDVAISPDGESVAYAEACWNRPTNDHKADLWIANLRNGSTSRLTFDRAGYAKLHWSADGHYIYAIAEQKQADANGVVSQLVRLEVATGRQVDVTKEPKGIGCFELANDGRALFHTKSRCQPTGKWLSLQREFASVEYGHCEEVETEICRLDLGKWRSETIAVLPKSISELALTPDGRWLAMVTAPEDKTSSYEGSSSIEILDTHTLVLHTLPDVQWRAQAPSPYGRLNSLTWSQDGRSLAFVIAFDGFPSEIFIAKVVNASHTIFKVPRPKGISLHAGVGMPLSMRWLGNKNTLCFLGEEKACIRIYSANAILLNQSPVYECLTPGDVAVDSFSVDDSGDRIAAILGTPEDLPDIFIVEATQKKWRLTQVNPQVSTWKIPQLRLVKWKGADGDDIEGILELPADAKTGQPLPTIVHLHGGPSAMWSYQLRFSFFSLQSLMSSKGYAIFTPNYRGSTGFGDQFMIDLIGRQNSIEVEDIQKGIDAMVEQGHADPSKLALLGWSAGGYLTNCLLAKTNRFKAASSGAGIAEMVMEWGITDEPAFPAVYVQGLPWQKGAAYTRASPIYEFGNVRTPTLFHVGERDERCPPENSRMLYRVLKDYLRTPTQLLVYRAEGHGLDGYNNRKAKMAWDSAWFDYYVLGKDTECL